MDQELIADPTVADQGGQPVARLTELPPVVFDSDDNDSVVNMLSDRLRDAIIELEPELFDMTEGELRREVKPTQTDYALRVSLWREIEKAWISGRGKIVTRQILAGICTEGYFYNKFLKDPRKVAWLVLPAQTYAKEMEAILMRFTQRYHEIADLEFVDAKGKVNVKVAELVLKAGQEVANRVKGLAVQRIAQTSKSEKRSVSVSMNIPSRAVPQRSVAELRADLAKLEAKGVEEAKEGPQGGRVIDADQVRDREMPSDESGRDIVTVGVVRARGEDR